VCKGPPLHHAVIVLDLLPSSSMLPRLESLYEACADGDIYTPGHLHTVRVCKSPPLHHVVLVFIYSRYY
ncbi:MAG: hypothetical protein LHW47_02735, partial [Candidatus Cloacimonetes bacterium]|nr:hypothetical protein [Candidatus Cloacimonadota bacterium]